MKSKGCAIARIAVGASSAAALILLLAWLAATLVAPAVEAKEKKPAAAQATALKPSQDLPTALDKAKTGATLTLGAGRFNGPLVVRGKSLTIQGQSGGGSVVYTDRADAVVIVTDGGKAKIGDIAFETGQDKRLAVYVNGGELELNGCVIANVKDDAIYVEAGSLALHGCKLSEIAGSAVIAASGATLEVSDSDIYRAGATGISLGQGVKARISKTNVSAPEAVVAVGAAAVTLENSSLSAASIDKSGVYLDVQGPLAVTGNSFQGGAPALYVKASNDAAVRIADNLIAGSARGGLGIELKGAPDKGPEIVGNRIIVAGTEETAFGILLRGATRATLADNRVAVRKGSGIVLEGGATGAFAGNVVVADASTVAFIETNAAASQLERDVLVPAGTVYGAPSLGDATRSLASVLADPAQADEWKRQRDDAIEYAATAAPPPLETYRTFFDALDQRAQTVRGLASAQARVSLVVVDAIGREGGSGFALLDESGTELSRHSAAEPLAPVAPGRYLVAPDIDPLNTIEAAVGAGESKVVRLERPSALWLNFGFGPEAAPTRHLVTLAAPPERARAAALLRRPWVLDALPDRRLDASADDVAAALGLARAWLQGGRDGKRPTKDDTKSWAKWHQTDRLAYSILALAGEASDVGWLTEFDKGNEYYWPGNTGIMAASLIEARLGTLGDGQLAATARGAKGTAGIAAALVLHRFGIRDHDQVAIDGVLQPSRPEYPRDYGFELLETMLDHGDERVLAVARLMLDLHKKRVAELAALSETERQNQYNAFIGQRDLAVIYLLAHGSAEDWRLVADEMIPEYLAATAAAFAADPAEMIAILGAAGQDDALYRYLTHIVAARPASAAQEFGLVSQHFYEIGYRAAIKANKASYEIPRMAEQWMNNFSGYSSAYLPNESAAEYYYKGAEGLNTNPLPWIEFEWTRAEVIDRFLAGDASADDLIQLDFIAHDELAKSFAEKNAAAVLPDAALVLAYHKVASRAHRVYDVTNSGSHISAPPVERRGFMVRKASTDQGYGGALSARLDVEPYFDGSTLKLRIGLPVAAFYHELCTLAAKISTDCNKAAWLHHEIATKPRKLITAVNLRRGDVVIPTVEDEPEVESAYVFSAQAGEHSVSGLWAEVSIGFFEQRRAFSFPLFAGTFAREQRLAAADIRRLEASPEVASSDPNALVELGRARQAYGETDAAWQAFEMALGRDPNLFDLWFEGAEMFSAVGRPARAAEILDVALQGSPNDADLLYALGITAYRAKDYARAAAAFGGVVAQVPDDHDSLHWQAQALFLARDWNGARKAYESLPAERRIPSIALLQTIATIEGAGGQTADLASFDAARKALNDAAAGGGGASAGSGSLIGALGGPASDVDQACRNDFYGGYRLKFEGKRDDAMASFERAKLSCAASSIERRAAQMVAS